MKHFIYKVCDTNGNILTGNATAHDKVELIERFKLEGKLVLNVREKGRFFNLFKRRGKIKANEMIVFNQELIALLQSGIPVDQAINDIAETQENTQFKMILNSVRDNIKGGMSLSEALSQGNYYFSSLYVTLIKAGEKTGDVISIIERYLIYMEKIEEFKEKVLSAITYPIILGIVLIMVLSILFTYVVPNFIKIYIETDVQLPLATRLLIGFTNYAKKAIFILIPAIAVSIPLFRVYRKSEKGIKAIDEFKIKLPFFGKTYMKYILSRFLRTLHTLLKSGIPVLTALDMSHKTLNNRYLENELKIIRERIEQGETFGNTISESFLFTGIAKKMLLTGDKSGQLGNMVEKVAVYFEKDVDRQIIYTVKFFEPIVMLVSGLLVAMVVVAMYLPIFKFGETIK